MAFSDKLTVVIDFVTGPAQSGLGKMRSEVKKAEGAFGKMQAAGSVAFDAVKANAANFAMAAGAALLAFGVKSVKAFQDTALAAGQFSDATGLAVDEASRFIEVAGDIGVEAGTVEAALGKMNKTLGGSPELFAELGVEIAKTGTGATDVNGTFLNVVDRLNAIEDPAERARVASQLLGKGWQGMAELIGQGSAELKASLAGVADAQVIDEKELKKAREFRERMDQLKDRLSAVALELGESLVPALTQMAENAVPAAQAVAKVADAWMTVGNAVKNTAEVSAEMYLQNGLTVDQLKEMGYSADEVSAALVNLGLSAVETTDVTADMARIYGERIPPAVEQSEVAVIRLRDATADAKQKADDLEAQWQTLFGTLDDEKALLNLQDQFDQLHEAGVAAYTAGVQGSDDAEAAQRRHQQAIIDTKSEVATYAKEVLGLPPEQVTKILADIEAGKIDEIERKLEILTRNRTANIDIITRGGAGYGDRFGGARAAGGPVTAGTPYLVGEKGPEIVVPGQSGTVIPNHRIGGSGGAGVGSPMVVNIYPKSLPTDRELIDLVTNLRRRNGGVI